MPSVPSPPALLTAATSGTDVLPAMPPRAIGWRMPSRSQTGVWITRGSLTEESPRTQKGRRTHHETHETHETQRGLIGDTRTRGATGRSPERLALLRNARLIPNP